MKQIRWQELLTGGGPHGAHGVNLIHKNDAGPVLDPGALEQVPDSGGAHPHNRLHKLAAAHLVEGHAGLACNRLGQQRLASAWVPLQQHPLGRLCAQRQVLLGVLQKLQR